MKKFVSITLITTFIAIFFYFLSSSYRSSDQSINFKRVNDYLAYYSSYQVYREGKNPYDPTLVEAKQLELGRDKDAMILQMWYAPWSYLFLMHTLYLDLASAASLWFLTNFFFAFISAILIWRSCTKESEIPTSFLLLAALHFPNFEAMRAGQFGLLLLLAISTFLYLIAHKRDLVAALPLIALTIKPHLFLPCAIYGVFWLLQSKRYKILFSFMLAIAIILLCCTIFLPGTLSFWIFNQTAPLTDFKTPTLAGLIRGLISENGVSARWPLFVSPILGSIITLIFIRARKKLIWQRDLAWLLTLGIFFAPYSWIHDQALLVSAQLILYAMSDQQIRHKVLIAACLIQSIIFLASYFIEYTSDFFWIPLLITCLIVYCEKIQEVDMLPSKS